ncbi:MAG TPA: protein kinase [Gemmataceae bacterium]|nr:protein kinase [Gemmataceae bacterium]
MVPSALSEGPRPPTLPETGDEVFHFRLRAELGRGAFARVFLAEQGDLAGRRVVIKCSTTEGTEPQTLAQLQHTNIVPIYSVHEDRQAGLRAVCMPYFGGASLAHVLQYLWTANARPTQGEELVRALEAVQSSAEREAAAEADRGKPPASRQVRKLHQSQVAAARSSGPTPLDLLRGLNYPRAAAWIVARLADGLQHAHQRGVLHHDIKPSNILLGTDGQPMLLDFNLARCAHDSQAQAAAVVGGTVAYMAPEHLRALISKDPQVKQQVDQRSDVYSLGMVLYEFLTGQGPFAHKGSYSALPVLIELMALERARTAVSARRKRPDVPWGLESIVRKCLAPDPRQRYQHAGHLATDLRRFLENLPLRYAPELSRRERVTKWLKRHPRLTSSATVAVVAAVMLGSVAVSLVGIRGHLAATQEQLDASRAEDRKRAFEAGTQRALCLVNTTAELSDHLRPGQEACAEALGLYGVLDRDDWQAQPAWQRLSAEERQRLGEDTRELLLLLAWSRARGAEKDPEPLREALRLLDRAEKVEGLPTSRALWEDRARYLALLGEPEQAKQAHQTAAGLRPAGVRDFYLLAASYARSGRYAEAVTELDQALKQSPRHYWSCFQRGICHQELGRHVLAAGDFGACIGLWPEFALGYFNRGYNLDRAGAKAEAVRDYGAAIERDPNLVPAYLNRGMACLELRRYEEALADFTKVAELGRDDAFLHAGRGVALEGLRRHKEADAAFRVALVRAEAAPEAVGTRVRWAYGFAVAARLPERAREAFDEVLAREPHHARALYGKAMLLAEEGKDAEALTCLNRSVEASPDFLEARRCRAVLQARRGNLDAAGREINACLAQAPDSGPVLYGAACVAAWVAQKSSDPALARQARAQALGLLEKAFARGYGADRAAKDPDLQGIQSDPGFARLLSRRPAVPAALSP